MKYFILFKKSALAFLLVAACLLLYVDVLHGQTIQIGASGAPPATQQSFYNGIPSPVYSVKSNARVQLYYTKAELNAAGMTGAQIIDSFSFYVFTLPAGAFQGYTVKMKSTQASFSNYDHLTGFSAVYQAASFTATAGWNLFQLQNPFYWNGNDNLVIDFCWSNVPATPATGGVWADQSANKDNILYFLNDNIPACNNYVSQEGGSGIPNFRPVMRLSYHPPAACAGMPVAVVTPAGINSVASGCSQRLEAVGNSVASGLAYQWEISVNGGTSWSNIPGATNPVYEFYPTANAQYCVTVSCASNTATSTATTVNISQPVFAALPYIQDFESWTNGCLGLKELPDAHWSNMPNVGLSSWRRDDEGPWAGWRYIAYNYGNFTPASVGGAHAARFHSWGAEDDPGILDLYVNCSTGPAGKALYFYYNDSSTNTFWNSPLSPFLFQTEDSLIVMLSTNGGNSFSTLTTITEAAPPGWTRVHIPFNSTAANTIIRFYARKTTGTSQLSSDIGLDSVYVADACNGTPLAGVIQNDTIISCSAVTRTLTTTGTSLAGGLIYQWQESPDGITWSNAAGGNALTFITPNLTDTMLYRLIVTCVNSGLADTTGQAVIFVPSPVYASLPYVEGFEVWTDYCDAHDRPAPNWLNTPANGNFSWRRDDEGNFADWGGGPGTGVYNYTNSYSFNPNYYSATHTNPPAIDGSHYARNHGGSAGFEALLWAFAGLPGTFPNLGKMNLYVDCSAPGSKELSFFYTNQGGNQAAPADDSLLIYLSTDGGNTFNAIWGAADNGPLWNYVSIPFNSNVSNTVIRFEAMADFEDGEMSIDRVRVAAQCSGQPVAGFVDSTTVSYSCPGDTFYVKLYGTSVAGGLQYEWQSSPNGSSWTSVPNSNTPVLATSISTDTWYRCIVECTASNLVDTTPARLIHEAPFYYCYCNSASDNFLNSSLNIGNVLLVDSLLQDTMLTNGNPLPYLMNPGPYNYYTDYRDLAPAPLAQNSTYQLDVTFKNIDNGILSGGAYPAVTAFIDFDRNGTYDPLEQVFFSTGFNVETMTANGTPISVYFTVPGNAALGLTGMRVIFDAYGSATNAPCGYTVTGETEDYLVSIEYPKCNGVPTTGIAYITDTVVTTAGSTVIVYDTAHAKNNSNLSWIWQSSTDAINWTDIAGSEMKDSITATISTHTYFRMRIACKVSQDTAYSNIVSSKPLSVHTLAASEGNVSLYPNPTRGKLELVYEGIQQKSMELTITDITGRELVRKRFTDIPDGFRAELDLSSYAKGLYIIKAGFRNGSLIAPVMLR